jgi:hypothetical protein
MIARMLVWCYLLSSSVGEIYVVIKKQFIGDSEELDLKKYLSLR